MGETWRSVRAVLVHELIRYLMWQAYYNDRRRMEVSLFEDYSADEFLTPLVEHIVLERGFSRVDYHGMWIMRLVNQHGSYEEGVMRDREAS
ncbi:MAG: hypothetical protein ACUVV4_08625 [Candidatus Bathyarchaeia archaeon]